MDMEEALVYIQEIYDFLIENYGEYDVPDQWLLAIERVMEEL